MPQLACASLPFDAKALPELRAAYATYPNNSKVR